MLEKRKVVLGTGWGAMTFVKDLNCQLYDVTIVSPRNYFLFTPLLPSTTVGTVDFKSIVEPIRSYLSRTNSSNVCYYEAECVNVNFERKTIECRDSHKLNCLTTAELKNSNTLFELPYDILVISVGSVSNTFNVRGVKEYCHFLKEIDDSIKIRRHIIDSFESVNLPSYTEEEKKQRLHFLVVGGGPTGVEFAGEFQDFLSEDLVKLYPQLTKYSSISLIESGDHVLNTFDQSLSDFAEKAFRREGIHLITNTRVMEVKESTVVIRDANGMVREIPYGLCVWSTGIAPNPLIVSICAALPTLQEHKKVLVTNEFLQVKGVQDVYALGDCATIEQEKLINHFLELFQEADKDKDGFLKYEEFLTLLKNAAPKYPQLNSYGKKAHELFQEGDLNKDSRLSLEEFEMLVRAVDKKLKNLPATAQVASQQGKYLAWSLNTLANTGKLSPNGFVYRHLGSLSYVGENQSVADLRNWKLGGFATWWLWRGVYWGQQTSIRNKVLIASDWINTFVFGRDSTRF